MLAVVAALAGLLTPLYSGVRVAANQTATAYSLRKIVDATSQYWADTKLVVLDGVTTTASEAERFKIEWLFRNPGSGDNTRDFDANTRIGWRGPYLLASTGDPLVSSTPFMIDAWNQTIVMQDVDSTATLRDVRIVSAGANGAIDIPATTATDALTTLDIGDDIYVALLLQ